MNSKLGSIFVSSTFALVACVALADTAYGQFTVHSDFDFANNTIPALFNVTPYGTGPTTGGGVLTFDGTTAIQASTTAIYGGSSPTNNYGYEVIITPSALNTFDISASLVDGGGTNSGSFLYSQGGLYHIIESGEAGSVGGTTVPTVGTRVALAFVMDNGTGRLFVNGVQESTLVFDASGGTPIDTATLEAVLLGGNRFDGAAGAFNGTIDRYRAFTFSAGQFNASNLLGPNDGTIATAAVPEPHSIAVWSLIGLIGLGYGVWRRRKQ
jgi:hypothetical protein